MCNKYLLVCILASLGVIATGQNVGIGTNSPERILEVQGFGSRYARVHASNVISESGIEFTYGNNYFFTPDWSLVNDVGSLKLFYSTNNFGTRSEVLRIDAQGELGIGTNIPAAPLHVDGGVDASNALNGYMLLGLDLETNLVMDNNEILARYNYGPSSLYLQNVGGTVNLQYNGGNTYMTNSSGTVNVHSSNYAAKLNVEDAGFQMFLRNTEGANDNDWYIGASSNSWVAGDDQLIFGPSPSTDASILRLRNTSDNNGTTAPVMIQGGSQKLLLDGNEIDCITGALYINQNTAQHTAINTTGGNVGIGTTSPNGKLHVKSSNANPPLSLKRGGSQTWTITPFTATEHLGFINDGELKAYAHSFTGQWVALSDGRFKKNITPMYNVLEKVRAMNILNYSFKHDAIHTRKIGVMAQELQYLFPELVANRNDHYLMSYSQLSVVAIKALQEQHERISELKARLVELIHEKQEFPEIINALN